MFGRKQDAKILTELAEVKRLLRLQGEAHSAIMNQGAATQEVIRKEVASLHERLSFNNRPKP